MKFNLEAKGQGSEEAGDLTACKTRQVLRASESRDQLDRGGQWMLPCGWVYVGVALTVSVDWISRGGGFDMAFGRC